MWTSIEILAPLWSSTIAFSSPPEISVKTEPGVDNVIDLSDSSNKDVPVQKVVVYDSPPLFPSASYVTPPLSCFVPSTSLVPSTSKVLPPIVQYLHRIDFMPGNKSVIKKIDYDKIKIQEVNHLLTCFDGTQLFVLLVVEISSSQTRAKSMDGMDKHYDGHVWTKTQTTKLQTMLALHFVSLPVLVISNAKTLVVITFNVPIVPLRSTTQNLKVSRKILSLSLALCHPDLLLCAWSAKSLPNALHYVMQKYSTSMEKSPPKELAFISYTSTFSEGQRLQGQPKVHQCTYREARWLYISSHP